MHLDSRVVAIARAQSLGAHGLPAIGEREQAQRIVYGMPDILGTQRSRYAGRKVLVVGAGIRRPAT